MKKTLYLILIVLNLFLFALVVHCAVEHPSPNNYINELRFSKSNNGNYYSIVDCLPGVEKELEIPGSYNNLPVTHIAANAFSKCSELEEIIIPDSITVIDIDAFLGCDSLVKIEVDDANEFYDSRYNCNAVIESKTDTLIVGTANTVIPGVVKTIGVGAFAGRKELVNIKIPENVIKICSRAFENCEELREFTLTKNISLIEDRVFAGCSALKSLVVEVDNPNYDSRDNCNAIIEKSSGTLIYGCKNTTIPTSIKTIGQYAFVGCEGLFEINIPSSVKVIGDYAFNDCLNLKNISLPSELTTIGNYAFAGCESLESFTLPKDTVTLGEKVLYNCPSLEAIVVEEGNTKYNSNNACNAIIESDTIIYGCSNTVIPANVTKIASYSFAYSSMIDITIPSNVLTIEENAFINNNKLENVIILNKDITILNNAFKDCSSIKSLFYNGSVEDWYYKNSNIFKPGNETLKSAERYYYSETEPDKDENYWHYVDGNIEIWK